MSRASAQAAHCSRSARFWDLDGDAQFSGRRRRSPIESDQGCIDATGNRRGEAHPVLAAADRSVAHTHRPAEHRRHASAAELAAARHASKSASRADSSFLGQEARS
jgi:hypothetical protein